MGKHTKGTIMSKIRANRANDEIGKEVKEDRCIEDLSLWHNWAGGRTMPSNKKREMGYMLHERVLLFTHFSVSQKDG